MNQESPAPSPTLSNEPSQKNRGILFKIVFVVVLLTFLFAILNYFNILPLSKLFPSYLGFLPRRDVPNGTSQSLKIENTNSRQGFPTPIPSLTENAKQALIVYLPTILDPSLIAASSSGITLTKDRSNQQGFIASWKTKEKNIDSSFHISQDLKKIIAVDFYVKDSELLSSISTETAMSKAAQIFSIEPKGTWGCKKVIIESMLYCENFWEQSENSKRGLGALIITSPAGDRTVYYLCEHTNASDLYSWKSCRPEFLKTGVNP
jgi:hypothetical protein